MAIVNFNPFVGEPIRSVQTYLRRISYTYPDIPRLIPDGRFGEQTKNSVRGFQKKFNMPQTGVVDKETWDKILMVHEDILRYEGKPLTAEIYPEGAYVILPGEENEHLFVLQSMMFVLSKHYANIPPAPINGRNDAATVKVVAYFQKLFGMQENGMIEIQFWNNLKGLYEAKVSRNRF